MLTATTAAWAFVLAILALMLGAIVVNGLKGKWGFVVGGFLIHLLWPIGAIRLAKPGSWWATRFYDELTMAESLRRHGP
jgi:hypothetical protein